MRGRMGVGSRLEAEPSFVADPRLSWEELPMSLFRRLRVCGWTTMCVVLAAAASAQTTPGSDRLYGLDPYKPSDAAWLRNYGSVLAGQTPVSVLALLDPYTPSHAALVRQLGGGMPLWSPYWFWFGPVIGPLMPPFPPAALPR